MPHHDRSEPARHGSGEHSPGARGGESGKRRGFRDRPAQERGRGNAPYRRGQGDGGRHPGHRRDYDDEAQGPSHRSSAGSGEPRRNQQDRTGQGPRSRHPRKDPQRQTRTGGARRGDSGAELRPRDTGRGGRRTSEDDAHRPSRPTQRQRISAPALPEDIDPADLERGARAELRALGRDNAQNVAKHLIMVQRLLDQDPQRAYEHARYASSRAGRVAVVRETAGIAAYLAGHYTEALREIRAARRLSGLDLHRAIEADCERALGHHSKALQVAEQADPNQLDDIERAELAMVVSGIRHEMGQTELGLIIIEDAIRARPRDRQTLRRLHAVRADRLEDLGRHGEARAIRERIGPDPQEAEEEIEVFDIQDEAEDGANDDAPKATGAQARSGLAASTGGDHRPHADSQDHEHPAGAPTGPEIEAGPTAQEAEVYAPAEAPAEAEEDDAQWSASFAQRVEAEMAELLEEAVPVEAGPDEIAPAPTAVHQDTDDPQEN